MKKSTIGIFIGIGISILAITFIPGLVKYLVPPIDTSSDSEPLSELELGHTYEFTVPTGVEKASLQTLIVIEGNFWYVEFEEGNYIGVNGGTISNTVDYLLYTNADISLLNDDYSNGPLNGTKEFTITHDATIHSNNIDLLPYLTDITEEQPLFTRVEAERYEVVFPMGVNGNGYTVGGIDYGSTFLDEWGLSAATFVFEDDDLINDNDGLFHLEFFVYLDSVSASQYTDNHVVLQGEYGRYVISNTQVADEPVAFTLEPIYEHVLVE